MATIRILAESDAPPRGRGVAYPAGVVRHVDRPVREAGTARRGGAVRFSGAAVGDLGVRGFRHGGRAFVVGAQMCQGVLGAEREAEEAAAAAAAARVFFISSRREHFSSFAASPVGGDARY